MVVAVKCEYPVQTVRLSKATETRTPWDAGTLRQKIYVLSCVLYKKCASVCLFKCIYPTSSIQQGLKVDSKYFWTTVVIHFHSWSFIISHSECTMHGPLERILQHRQCKFWHSSESFTGSQCKFSGSLTFNSSVGFDHFRQAMPLLVCKQKLECVSFFFKQLHVV